MPNEHKRMKKPELLPATKRRLVQKLELAQKSQELLVSLWIGVGPTPEEAIRLVQPAVAQVVVGGVPFAYRMTHEALEPRSSLIASLHVGCQFVVQGEFRRALA